MFIGRNRAPGTKESLAASEIVKLGRGTDPVATLQDKRKVTERLQSLQSVIRQGAERKRITRKKHWQLQSAQNWLDKNALPMFESWSVMEVSEYLKRNHLKQKYKRKIRDTSVIVLADDSAIFIFDDLFWRHESASQASIYFDSSHVQCPDLTKSHFLTKKGRALCA